MLEPRDHPRLPEGFVFATSTASYEIEGAVGEDRRGRDVWDTSHEHKRRIVDGSSGAMACHHYQYAEEMALMKSPGSPSTGSAIAWPRIQADGSGTPNENGLAFHDRLVDELLEARITAGDRLGAAGAEP